MIDRLKEVQEAIERIRRDYPDVPVRFEFARDVFDELMAQLPKGQRLEDSLIGLVYATGIPCVVDEKSAPGEWGPVFRTRG